MLECQKRRNRVKNILLIIGGFALIVIGLIFLPALILGIIMLGIGIWKLVKNKKDNN